MREYCYFLYNVVLLIKFTQLTIFYSLLYLAKEFRAGPLRVIEVRRRIEAERTRQLQLRALKLIQMACRIQKIWRYYQGLNDAERRKNMMVLT